MNVKIQKGFFESKKFLFAALTTILAAGMLTGCSEKSAKKETSAKSAANELPKLDSTRIAEDRKRGIVFSNDGRTLIRYNKDLTETEYTVPNGVTTIDEEAFRWCDKLTRVKLPDSVTIIRRGAFMGCSSLTDVNIPSGFKSKLRYCFTGCPCEESLKRAYPHLFEKK